MPKEEVPADPGSPAGQFAAHLRALLEKHRRRSIEVANAVEVSEVTVSRWLAGRRTPSLDQCDAIAKALGLKDWWELFQRGEGAE